DGSSCANAKAASFFNTASNWGSGNPIAPGKTVGLCGTITSELDAQGSGTPGNPITILFTAGAKISQPAVWAFNVSNRSWITIDGGTNGIIESTSNGTGLANNEATKAIQANPCSNCTFKNIHFNNLYVRSQGQSLTIDGTLDNAIYASGAN